MSGEYSKKYRQGSIFTINPSKWILKTDPCQYLVKYSLDVLKENKGFSDTLNTDKIFFMKIDIE